MATTPIIWSIAIRRVERWKPRSRFQALRFIVKGRLIRWGGAAAAVLIGIASWQLVARQWGDVDLPNRDVSAMNSTPIVLDKSVTATTELNATHAASGLPPAVFRDLTGDPSKRAAARPDAK